MILSWILPGIEEVQRRHVVIVFMYIARVRSSVCSYSRGCNGSVGARWFYDIIKLESSPDAAVGGRMVGVLQECGSHCLMGST